MEFLVLQTKHKLIINSHRLFRILGTHAHRRKKIETLAANRTERKKHQTHDSVWYLSVKLNIDTVLRAQSRRQIYTRIRSYDSKLCLRIQIFQLHKWGLILIPLYFYFSSTWHWSNLYALIVSNKNQQLNFKA